jgi:hypothetical protein
LGRRDQNVFHIVAGAPKEVLQVSGSYLAFTCAAFEVLESSTYAGLSSITDSDGFGVFLRIDQIRGA